VRGCMHMCDGVHADAQMHMLVARCRHSTSTINQGISTPTRHLYNTCARVIVIKSCEHEHAYALYGANDTVG